MKNRLPIIASLALALGVLLGVMLPKENQAANANAPITESQVSFPSASNNFNKLNYVLMLLKSMYVDSIKTDELTEKIIPMVLEELDPHSTYVPKEEAEMARAAKTNNPLITAETSCNYLWFSNEDYARLGSKVKCNPAVKSSDDRAALRMALAEGTIDTIGSDHAPHLLSEKEGTYTEAPSGLPSIQQSLPVLLTIAHEEDIPLGRIASAFSEKAADLYHLNRGKIEKGYEADLVIFDYSKEFVVKAEDQYSKCGWTPYEGETLRGVIETVFIDGKAVLKDGRI